MGDPVFAEIVLVCGDIDCVGELVFPEPGEYSSAIGPGLLPPCERGEHR